MRVLHVITGLESGGAERNLRNLVLHQSQILHVVVSLTGLGKYGKELGNAGIRVYALNSSKSPRSLISAIFTTASIIRSIGPDVVQTWMYHADLVGGLAARFAGKGAVSWNLRATKQKFLRANKVTFLLAHFLALVSWIIPDAILACGAQVVEDHKKIGYRRTIITTIPNGIDVQVWSKSIAEGKKFRKAIGASGSETVFGLIGRLHPQKNHRDMLESVKILAARGLQVRLVLLGSGTQKNNPDLQELIDDVAFPPHLLHGLGEVTDVRGVINGVDFLALPSLYGEGFPNVLLEAMACETPCISSSSGDCARIIGDTGWVFPAGNRAALTEALYSAVKANSAARANLGKLARARVESLYSLEQMGSHYAQHFNLLARRETKKSRGPSSGEK